MSFHDFDKIQILQADIDIAVIKLDRIANQANSQAARESANDARTKLRESLEAVLANVRHNIKVAEKL